MVFVVLVATTAGWAACGGDDAMEAQEGCRELVTAICQRGVQCNRDTRAEAQTLCEQSIATQFDCGQAKKLADSFDRCVSEVRSFQCAVIWPSSGPMLPASCQKVVLR